jgi:hypothetical protein
VGSWPLRWFTRTPFDSGPRLQRKHIMKIEGDYVIFQPKEVVQILKKNTGQDYYRYVDQAMEWERCGEGVPYRNESYEIRRPIKLCSPEIMAQVGYHGALSQHFI